MMKNRRILFYFFLMTIVAFSCKKDTPEDNNFYFNADFDGVAFSTDEISGSSAFGIYSIVIQKDGDEIVFNLNDRSVGVYEIGGTDNAFTADIDITYSGINGTIEITEASDDGKTISGTVNVFFESNLPSTIPEIDVTNGEFRMKFFN